MRKEPPRVSPLNKVRHKQPGDREENRNANESEPSVESGRSTGLTELEAETG